MAMDFSIDAHTSNEFKKIIKEGYINDIKDQSPFWAPLIQLLGGPRAENAFNHSLLKEPRQNTDFAKVYVWQYQYKDPISKELIIDNKPISSQKKYWKTEEESRIIAMTFYGSVKKYFDSIIDFIDSIKHIKKLNDIPDDELWGYETFILRIYVAQRNPLDIHMGP
jgi:hypothetical protein